MENTMIAPTIVQLNNDALSCFLQRDYESSIALLRCAYETFEIHSRRPDLRLAAAAMMQMQASASSSGSNMQFMEHHERDGGDSDVSSSSSAPHQEQEQPYPQQQLPSAAACADHSSSSSSSTCGSTSSQLGDFRMDSTLVKEKALRSSQIEPTCHYASSPDTACSMYNRALVFSAEDSRDDFSLLVTYRYRTAATILYNLALVHHTIGIQLGVSAALPHAVRLYELALESIVGSGGSNAADIEDANNRLLVVQKLVMAILNNLGNIFTHLYQYQNAQQCFSHLRLVLAASGSVLSIAGGASDEDYTFFFLNSVFQGRELCFAPAA